MNIEEMKVELEKSVGTKLFGHCVRTMEEAVKLAKNYNVDVEKAKLAGLLHDCGKLWDKQTDNLKHAKVGAELAKKSYSIQDVDILNAIRYHTTGREAMSLLEKIIYIADKIEPNRNFAGVEEIRELAYNNINEAIIKSLISTISFVKQRNLELDSESLKTLNYLNKRR
ncbi:putative nucleotidyltransferase with HDIG domain [Sedimentibacter acidaminivorans]|jgi:putative nucleotidyltransferase with HDIG domain|uniref:bis(5'-nucleosyl)-tetraphosphatase (symmetrical) n=1 Tax=Sedimentibacter acidaminivorans TaxID=913099 RepID=A0ABS4GBR5_9FIRM|nr:bis(5'-nucleosyl)-tetraphosphatase (symmetrical) YqeK [Sedimentibacter acidaminivorans]MBP1924972.1 putative nucleotidyltransferase with HDIG domain [Sedimentibacter acidaminivorans]